MDYRVFKVDGMKVKVKKNQIIEDTASNLKKDRIFGGITKEEEKKFLYKSYLKAIEKELREGRGTKISIFNIFKW